MAGFKLSSVFVIAVLLQEVFVNARPSDCGCGGGLPIGGCGGGLPIGGSFGGGIDFGGEGLCGPIPQPSPPVSFVPVPQPVPIRIPSPRPQSVTIPNIIVALLPPNNKPVIRPRPIIRPPPPAVIPIPQPYPLPIRSGCDAECSSGPILGGGIGNVIQAGLSGGIGCGC